MAKKSNRETVIMGMPTRPTGLTEAITRANATPPELAQLRDEQFVKENRSRFAEVVERETAAAKAHFDAIDALPPLFTGSADPADIVGLDGFTPDSDTPKDGDSTRPDSDPS